MARGIGTTVRLDSGLIIPASTLSGTPVAGKVWTASDTAGNGSWQTPVDGTLTAFVNVATFTNSWTGGGTFSVPAYRKSGSGVVYLRGGLTGGTVGSSAFALPTGFRPATRLVLVVISNSAVGRVDIDTDGTVTPRSPSSNVFVSLDGVSFTI